MLVDGLPTWSQAQRDIATRFPGQAFTTVDEASSGDAHRVTAMVVAVQVTTGCNACQDTLMTVADPTGDMPCCVHGEVLEVYPSVACNGTVMIVRNVAVMDAARRSLIVCLENVVRAYEMPAKAR